MGNSEALADDHGYHATYLKRDILVTSVTRRSTDDRTTGFVAISEFNA